MRILLVLIAATVFFGCRQEELQNQTAVPKLVKVTIEVPGVSLDSVIQINDSTFIQLSAFKFYLSNFKIAAGNTSTLVKDAFLVDLDSSGQEFTFELPEQIESLNFGIGVPPGINTGDPTVFSNSHPLSIKGSAGMHWNWNSGYKFIVFDGKMDKQVNGSFTAPFSFHTGTDTLYRPLSFSMPSNTASIVIRIDAKELVKSINIWQENQTHTSGNPDLARRFTNNFVDALSVEFSSF